MVQAADRLVATVRDLVERALATDSVELIDVQIKGSTGNQVVTVTIDAGSGVTTEDCVKVSRAVSAVLDEADPIPGRYRLDVESPGLERPLTIPADFRRAVGQNVQIKRRGFEMMQGVLESADDSRVVLDVSGERVDIPIDEVARARTVVDWAAALNAGKGRDASTKQVEKVVPAGRSTEARGGRAGTKTKKS